MTARSLTRRSLFIAGLATPAIMPSLASAFSKTFALADAFPYLDKFLALPISERSHLNLTYRMVAKAGGLGGVRVSVINPAGQKTPLTLSSNGRLDPLPTAGMLHAGYQLLVERPDSTKLGISMELLPVFAMTTEVSPREPKLAIAQANAAIHKVAGPAGLIMPKLKQVIFRGSVSGQIMQTSGMPHAMPMVDGSPGFAPQNHPNAVLLKLTRSPTSLEFES